MRRRGGLLIGLWCCAIGITGCQPPESADTTQPIRIERLERTNPPFHAVVARVDLYDPRVHLVICDGGPDPDGPGPWETVLRTPSDIARDHQLDLAINGGFFMHLSTSDDPTKYSAGDPSRSANLVMIDGKIVTRARDGAGMGIDADGTVHFADSAEALAETGVKQVISGDALIVDKGEPSAKWDDPQAPRSAVGVTQDGKTLILMAIDGRRPNWGLGVTLKQLSQEMIRQGAYYAINLDGGGSTSLVKKTSNGYYQVLNRPSDGATLSLPLSVERPVPYVLGVRVSASHD